MQLPGRLSSSTLGDLLGSLHRQRITGTVELSEIGGARGFAGRAHRVHLRGGLVVAIDGDLAPYGAPLGDRMDALFRLRDARIAFRTARPLPRGATGAPLGPADFLYGRPRARDRGRAGAGSRPTPSPPPSLEVHEDPVERARRLLGVSRGAGLADVRRAFRRLASALHPDRAPPGDEERLAARFAELSAAYHLLVA
jgi:hypothetical protein